MTERDDRQPCAWVVAADMGLGHQRAAHPLRAFAVGGVLAAGSREVTSPEEYALWNRVRRVYDFLSRARQIPVIGAPLYALLHAAEEIERFYPRRDLSAPSLQAHSVRHLIRRRGLGRTLLARMEADPRPLLTTFYVPALAADYLGYSGRIYCVICDTDINRVWVADDPRRSRVHYLAPCETVVRRLRQYGVREEHIHLTGFPLPQENLGPGPARPVLRADVAQRLANLDPAGAFAAVHRVHLEAELGAARRAVTPRPPTILFSIGGAGAQTEIAVALIRSLRAKVRQDGWRLLLGAGMRAEVARELDDAIDRAGLGAQCGRGVEVLWDEERGRYFDRFNRAMRTTDVLWTKPSELTFYAGLGLPLVLAPPIGPHEILNRKWARAQHGGLDQEDPRYADEWLADWLSAGVLAEAAWQGFLHCAPDGVDNIAALLGSEGESCD